MLFVLMAVPYSAKSACNFNEENKDDYFIDSVPGIKTFQDNLPSYEYNNRYYATDDATENLAECLGGTVTTIPSGWASNSPYQKPDALGVQLPNGQVINAGDAITMFLLSGANNGGLYYNNWVSYVNLPDSANHLLSGYYTNAGSYAGSGATVTQKTSSGSTFTQQASSGANYASTPTSYASMIANISNQIVQIYKDLGVSSGATSQYNSSSNLSSGASVTTKSEAGNPDNCYILTSDLQIGSYGAETDALIKFLVKQGFLPSIRSSFDNKVQSAVAAYQEKYASDILNPAGLISGTGFVGPLTRAHINSLCSKETSGGSFTSKSTSGSSFSSKTKNFNYTFTKLGDLWKVTLDNASYGSPTDLYYVSANYSITKGSADELRQESEGRFNSPYYFPGTPEGNTFYSEMFSAFIRAYYDWSNQTKNIKTTPVGKGLSFTTNVVSTMKVGSQWVVSIGGLNFGETVSAIGGKRVNGNVPNRTVYYTADNTGSILVTDFYTEDMIGTWQVTWQRNSGEIISIQDFIVE